MGYVYESSEEDEEEENVVVKKKKKRGKNVKYVGVGSVDVIHRLLMLEELYGMSKHAFVDLCLEAAGERKLAKKEEMVPLPVLHDFAIEFVRGLTRLMHRLGFSRGPLF